MANHQTQPSTTSPPVQITLLPGANSWPTKLTAPTDDRHIRARAQLGIPTDQPIVASGHQPILFHPGIVAKLIAMNQWSRATGAVSVWVVPDQDVVDPALVRLPDDSGEVLTDEQIRIGGEANTTSPAAALPPVAVDPDLPESLEPIGSWLMGYQHEASRAKQFTHATLGMLCEQLGLDEPVMVFASDLLAIDVGRSLVERMVEDPIDSIHAYNSSVAEFSHAGVRPLKITPTHVELPLWRVEGGERLPVFVEIGKASAFDHSNLLPCGLLMTAIMRLAICDLFIHGTGGYEYDQITEHWMRAWGGHSIAPIVGVSATMTLGLGGAESAMSPDRAVWLAHHARHNPAMLGDQEAARKKTELVLAIAESKANKSHQATAQLFTNLHQLLDQTRSAHADRIRQFEADSSQAQRMRLAHELANELSNDRTWAFPLYSEKQLELLKDEIVRALAGAG
jgi:hypothetical protein